MPSDEVARRSYPPLLLPTKSLPYEGAVDVPVPPRATERKPVHEGVNVWVSPDDVIVRRRFVSEEVANVWDDPV
jgi:hypothetical protein